MNWELLRYSIFAFFPVLTIFFVARRKYVALMGLYLFTFPFQNCSMYFLTTWNPYKIVALGMLWALMTSGKGRRTGTDVNQLFSGFKIVLIVSSLIGLVTVGSSKGFMRLLMQDVTYLLGFVPLFFVKLLPSDGVSRMFQIYKYAMMTTIAIGFVHYAFISMGIPFAPIFRDVGGNSEIAQSLFGSSVVTRIYGFSGEPKNMAFYMAPFLLAMFACVMNGQNRDKKNVILLVSAAFILLNTYSSAAFIETVLGMVVVLYLLTNSGLNLSGGRKMFLFLMVVVSISYIVYSLNSGTENFVSSFYERSFGRAEDELEEGRMENMIVDQFWRESPLTWICGYGAGLYSFHSNGLVLTAGFNPVQSGLVLNLVDFGIMGYIYYLSVIRFLLKVYRRIKRKLSYGENEPLFFFIAGITTLIGNLMYSMLGGNIITGMMPFIAVAYWYSLDKDY